MRIGLVLAGLLGFFDLIGPALTDGKHPPYAIAFLGAVLGAITLAGVVVLWRGSRSRGWIWAVLGTRTISALTSVPAFFAGGVPAPLVAVLALSIVLTAAVVVLLGPVVFRRA